MIGKRGISPLIATIVLIAFAVSLGAVVMSLGSNFGGPKNLDAKECTGMQLQFHALDGQMAKFSGTGPNGFIEFIVDHVGTEPITQIRIRVIGSKGGSTEIFVSDLPDSSIQPGYPLSKKVPYDYDLYGQPKELDVVPLTKRGDKTITCLGNQAQYKVP
ncbi:MAG: hypothetical protein EPN86_05845 [Nanoarchaeota archaeon]|nr:MAG: hypothetical protein EPN86_05845 [Nanoarchaeota archaeon]